GSALAPPVAGGRPAGLLPSSPGFLPAGSGTRPSLVQGAAAAAGSSRSPHDWAQGRGDIMNTTAAPAGLSGIKARQQETWASGDFAVIASRIVLVSELLAEAADPSAGWTA